MRILAAKRRGGRWFGPIAAWPIILPVMLAAAALCAGCGQGASGSSTTISLTSPGVLADNVVSPKFSCGYAPIWLPLKWDPVPSGTEELFLFFDWFKGGADNRKVSVSYATMIGKIDASRHEYAANSATVSGGFAGYRSTNSCPAARRGQHMLMEVFALPRHRPIPSMTRAFVTGLTEAAVTGHSSRASPPSVRDLLEETLGSGDFIATYGRPQPRRTRISDPSEPPQVELPPGPSPRRLVVEDIRKGSGVAVPRKGDVKIRTNFVAVSYRTGRPYETRWSRHGSFNIGFGPGIEIKGWEKGLPGMRVGGRRELRVPSKLAYGEGALLYVVDLLAVE